MSTSMQVEGARPNAATTMRFYDIVMRDLAANTHRRGLRGALVATVFTPGFSCILRHRIIYALCRKGRIGRLLGKLVWRAGVSATACYIHYDARIGPGLALPHPTGIVIGEDAEVGADVTIYQHVTIGRINRTSPNYPVIGDRVTMYTGSIVAGEARVGDGATLGAYAMLLGQSVPPHTVVSAPDSAVRIRSIDT